MSKLEEKMEALITDNFTFKSTDQTEIFVHKWLRKEQTVKGIVQISHGMAETAARYERFAKTLTKSGFIVYANDHRGHGQTAQDVDSLGYLGAEDGFKLLVQDIAKLTDIVRAENPNVPIYLFSHSMGSFAAQRYIMDYPNQIEGLILSGSNGPQGLALTAGKVVAKIEMRLRGKKAKSKLMNKLTFGTYNRNFKPQTTGSEWLTRDENELNKYLQNPYCGTIFPTSFYYEFLDSLMYVENEENFHKIPKNLPIFIISGNQDPVGDFGKGLMKLQARYEKSGVQDLEMKLYEGARHELLNEVNREEVTQDILMWLEARAARKE